MSYEPRLPVPSGSLRELAEWLQVELQRKREAEDDPRDFIVLSTLHAEPEQFVADMLVRADGSDWNPGSGAGYYRRNEANDAWVLVV